MTVIVGSIDCIRRLTCSPRRAARPSRARLPSAESDRCAAARPVGRSCARSHHGKRKRGRYGDHKSSLHSHTSDCCASSCALTSAVHDPKQVILDLLLPDDRGVRHALHLGERALHPIEVDPPEPLDVAQYLRNASGQLLLLPALAFGDQLTNRAKNIGWWRLRGWNVRRRQHRPRSISSGRLEVANPEGDGLQLGSETRVVGRCWLCRCVDGDGSGLGRRRRAMRRSAPSGRRDRTSPRRSRWQTRPKEPEPRPRRAPRPARSTIAVSATQPLPEPRTIWNSRPGAGGAHARKPGPGAAKVLQLSTALGAGEQVRLHRPPLSRVDFVVQIPDEQFLVTHRHPLKLSREASPRRTFNRRLACCAATRCRRAADAPRLVRRRFRPLPR